MYRNHLPENAGMLFIFDRTMPLSFWGHNTFIPLDIAFIDKSGTVKDIKKIKKLSDISVRSSEPCLMALEVNAGFFAKHNINIGDNISVKRDQEQWLLSFAKDQGNKPKKTEPSIKIAQAKMPRVHAALPFGDDVNEPPTPEWMQDVRDFLPTRDKIKVPPQPTGYGFNQSPETQPTDDESLPEVSMGDIMMADEDDNDWSGVGDEDTPEMSPENFNAEQGQQAEEQGPLPPEEVPDPRRMSVADAMKYAEQHGLVVWINYRVKSKKKRIGMTPQRVIHRIIQPHGSFNAKTTGNNIEVTWDMTVNDFRAFITSQITAKGFTGQTFRKWFRVKP